MTTRCFYTQMSTNFCHVVGKHFKDPPLIFTRYLWVTRQDDIIFRACMSNNRLNNKTHLTTTIPNTGCDCICLISANIWFHPGRNISTAPSTLNVRKYSSNSCSVRFQFIPWQNSYFTVNTTNIEHYKYYLYQKTQYPLFLILILSSCYNC